MTINVEAHLSGYVLLITYRDPFEMADIVEMTQRVKETYMDKTTHLIHIISDFTGVTTLPRNLLANSRALIRERHPMAGKNIMVIRSSFLMTIAKALLTLRRSEFIVLCQSLDEAWQVAEATLAQEGVYIFEKPAQPPHVAS